VPVSALAFDSELVNAALAPIAALASVAALTATTVRDTPTLPSPLAPLRSFAALSRVPALSRVAALAPRVAVASSAAISALGLVCEPLGFRDLRAELRRLELFTQTKLLGAESLELCVCIHRRGR
jgi:hypothetical protein